MTQAVTVFSLSLFRFLLLSMLPTLSPFTFIPSPSLFYVSCSFWICPLSLPPHCPLFFLVSFSISLCTPTRSDIDCYARRIAPYTLTLCCKSFIESGEVFLREACIISEFGCSWCSCLGAGPVLQFHCCSAVARCFGRIQGRRLAGRRDYSANTQTKCRTGIGRTGMSI